MTYYTNTYVACIVMVIVFLTTHFVWCIKIEVPYVTNQSVKSSSVVVNAQFRKRSVSSFPFARVIRFIKNRKYAFLYLLSIIVSHLLHNKYNVFEGLLYPITGKKHYIVNPSSCLLLLLLLNKSA